MAEMPARSRRIVGLALVASAGILAGMALAIWTDLAPVGGGIRGTVGGAPSAAAVVDLLPGVRFLRTSLSA